MTAANTARGEVAVTLNGRARRLCLTLGALAEIEGALAASGAELAARLAKPGAREILVVLGALLRGGGEDIDDAALAREAIRPDEAARAIAAAFCAIAQ